MSKLMQRNAHFIKLLSKIPPQRRSDILKHAPKELITALSEGALNVLQGNVRLSKRKLASLRRYRTQLRQLASRTVSARRKRALVLQRGGFLGALAGVLIPAITGLIGALT